MASKAPTKEDEPRLAPYVPTLPPGVKVSDTTTADVAKNNENTNTSNTDVTNAAATEASVHDGEVAEKVKTPSAASNDQAKKLDGGIKAPRAASVPSKNEDHYGNKTPRINVEVRSPPSSNTRGQLRAASLNLSPLAAETLASPSGGFGAGVRNVPPPIVTQVGTASSRSTQAKDLREPAPRQQIPAVTQILGQGVHTSGNYAYGQAHHAASQPALSAPVIIHQSASQQSTSQVNQVQTIPPARLSGTLKQGNVLASVFEKDPYQRRADEIGPQHGIPGIGHLGDMLAPLGWKIGQEPCDEASVRRIYDASRAQAKKELNGTDAQLKKSGLQVQEKYIAQRNLQWNKQLKLDDLLLRERISVYRVFQQYKHEQARAAKQPGHAEPLQRAQTVPPPDLQRYQILSSPRPSPPLSGGSLFNRLQQLKQDLHFPHSPISPGFLDPSLVPQTLVAVDEYYAANRRILLELNNANEDYWRVWSAKYGRPVVPRQSSSYVNAAPANARVEPVSVPNDRPTQLAPPPQLQHTSYPAQGGYPVAVQSPFMYGQPAPTMANHYYGRQNMPGPSGLSQQYFIQAPHAPQFSVSNKHTADDMGVSRQKASVASSPKKKMHKKRASNASNVSKSLSKSTPKRADKTRAQYNEEIATTMANLPTSTISAEALDAGRRFNPYQPARPPIQPAFQRPVRPQAQAPAQAQASAHPQVLAHPQAPAHPQASAHPQAPTQPAPNRRTTKPSQQAFPIDNRTAQVLIAAGIKDTRPQAAQQSNTAMSSVRIQVPPALPALPISAVRSTQNTSISASHGAQSSSRDSPLTSLGTESNDEADDPTDTTYGPRTPRKTGKAATSTKRRSSNATEPVQQKRSRHST